MLILLALPAMAQSVDVDPAVLTSDASLVDGVGAPSVVYSAARLRYLMFFEARIAPPAGCSEGWAIGVATSADGVAWTKKPGALVGPGPVAECGPRAPAAALLDDGSLAMVFTATDLSTDAGVGVWTMDAGVSASWRAPALDGLREPSIARVDGTWQVVGVDDAVGLVTAESTDLVAWTLDASAAVPAAATPWSIDGMFSPALDCIQGDPVFPWSLYYGGWTGSDTAWAWSVGDDFGNYYVSPAIDSWVDDSAWVSFDVLRTDAGDMIWYEHVGSDGLPRIGHALSGTPDIASVHDRDCTTTP